MTREQAILDFVEELSPYQMHGFILTLQGETLAEGSYAPFRNNEPSRMYSVSKSVVSLAIGLLSDAGALALDDPICGYFPEWVDDRTPALLRRVTIRDMLRMATCYDRSMYGALADADWTRPFFTGTPTHAPGTVFSYDTSASQVLGALVERLTGRPILAFMQEKLFDRIGMTGPKRWLTDGQGVSQGGSGLLMSLRDCSKLANFCMSDGLGILSSTYLRAATSRQIATSERPAPEERWGYGYQFWMMREGFYLYGLGGQMALCLPQKQLALVTTADLINDSVRVQPIFDAFFRHLARIDALPSDPADAARLQARLAALRVQPVCGTNARSLHTELKLGALPFSALEIRPEAVTLTICGVAYTLPCRGGEWQESVFPASQERCIISGAWVEPDRFELVAKLCGDFIAYMKLFVQVNGSAVTARVVSTLWEFQAGWSGQDWGTIMEE